MTDKLHALPELEEPTNCELFCCCGPKGSLSCNPFCGDPDIDNPYPDWKADFHGVDYHYKRYHPLQVLCCYNRGVFRCLRKMGCAPRDFFHVGHLADAYSYHWSHHHVGIRC